MAKIKLTNVPFNGTPEQEAQLREELQVLKTEAGSLMRALQAAQGIYEFSGRRYTCNGKH